MIAVHSLINISSFFFLLPLFLCLFSPFFPFYLPFFSKKIFIPLFFFLFSSPTFSFRSSGSILTTHLFTYSYIRSFIHSFTHLFIYLFTYLLIAPRTPAYTRACIYICICICTVTRAGAGECKPLSSTLRSPYHARRMWRSRGVCSD